MDLWKLWPTNQTNKHILMSYVHEASSKLTAPQKEMVKKVREMDKNKRTLI
jgi:rRNA maturation endonuclease Nob1